MGILNAIIKVSILKAIINAFVKIIKAITIFTKRNNGIKYEKIIDISA